jgi:mutator protein MutT
VTDIVNALLTRNGQILLARRSPLRSKWPDCWSFPGGHVEPGETFDQALVRELAEEIGVVPTAWATITTLNYAPQSVSFHMFLVTDWMGEPTLLGDEHTELTWIEPYKASRLPDLALEAYPAMLRSLVL